MSEDERERSVNESFTATSCFEGSAWNLCGRNGIYSYAVSMPSAKPKPTRRSGRVLVVGLREIIQDSRSSPRIRLSACRLLATCEGILPLRKQREKTANEQARAGNGKVSQKAGNPGRSGLASLAALVNIESQ